MEAVERGMEDNTRVEDSRNKVETEVPVNGEQTEILGAAGTVQAAEMTGAVPGAFVGGMPVNGEQTEILGAPETAAVAGSQTPESAKKPGAGKKFLGVLELLAAVALLALAGWMFYNTRGTRLLYVDVDFGRMCKYYWAPAAGALVFFAVGLYTLKRAGREVKKDGKLE